MIKARATNATQALVDELFSLDRHDVNGEPTVLLPSTTLKLPRQKVVPQEREKTKWEKYAAEKGIVKRKKERMIYDEVDKTYKPRWGYKRANDESLDPVIELKSYQADDYDAFAERKNEKKLRVLKNKEKMLKNRVDMKRNKKVDVEPEFLANDVGGKRGKGKGKIGTKRALTRAQLSTASLGKFDKKIQNEPEKPRLEKRRKRTSNISGKGQADDEKERMLRIANRHV